MIKKKKNKSKGGMISKYNNAKVVKYDKTGKRSQTNGKVYALKTGVDIVSAAATGPLLGAGLGPAAPFLGIFLIGLGQFLDDKTGLLRLTGAAAIGYGIAKSKSNRDSMTSTAINGASMGSIMEDAKQRLIDFKSDWLHAFYLDKIMKPESTDTNTDLSGAIGAIDLSALDVFDDLNESSAEDFEAEQMSFDDQPQIQNNFETQEIFQNDLEGIDYALEEDIDFSVF